MPALALAVLLLPVVLAGARPDAGLPPDATAVSNGTRSRMWPIWADTSSDVCDGDTRAECISGITCFAGDLECDARKPCPEYHVCVHGFCQCKFPFPKRCKDYIENCDDQNFLSCHSGLCYKYLVEEESWTTMMEPFLIGGIVCFFCVAVGLCACKSLITPSPPRRRVSDSAQSVSSMQRWIDERLRDRPPRYDEMLRAAAATPPASSPAAASAASPAHLDAEKPPSYDFAMAEHQTSGQYEQTPDPDGPPPPYSRLAMALMEDDGMGFSNPCFEGDDVAPSASTLSLTSVSTLETSPSFRSTSSSTSSSCSSYVSAWSADPPQLLTISQAVALQEMMLGDTRGEAPDPGTSPSTDTGDRVPTPSWVPF